MFMDYTDTTGGRISVNAAEPLVFRTNSTDRMSIDGSGNVGIGVVPETWKSGWDALQIGASGSIFGIASGNENMSIASNAYLATDGNYKYIATNEASQYLQSAGVHYFRNVASGTADTNITWNDRMVIDSSGNVGIGVSPTHNFNLQFAGTVEARFRSTDADCRLQISSDTDEGQDSVLEFLSGTSTRGSIAYDHNPTATSQNMLFKTGDNAVTAMTIDGSGNVGIGAAPQTAPYYNNDDPVLTVHKASGNAILPIVGAANTSSAILHLNQSGNRYWRMSAIYGGQLTFGGKQPGSGAAESEAMRIDQSNRLLIGHTTAVGGHSELLGIDTGASSGYGIFISGPSSTNGQQYAFRFWDSGSSPGLVGSITFTTNSTAYNTSSDYRLKENVVTDWDATTRLKQLKPSRFNFISDPDTTMEGFLAHEVQDIVPEAVVGEKDAVDAEGNPKYQGIDQSKLVPLLVKALQEQQTIIDDLKSRIEALEE